ncbi:nucleotidyltransferase family protein [Bosea sp. NBC_00550]|uniref:nucleotidyltransferase family protein n=1 Tax=Bosea sp. NBC_00550 TaxID=2969621 RepID=UPI00222F2485|nr:nucleotidyltransferase family protein [Bosea sp. NBC_00550]UZF90267.1 nucleotidyltransferase family protein [Bosea sp. NBC_00550]
MTRDEATAELICRAKVLRDRGAQAAFVYGSTARDEARENSDIDIFIDVEPGRKFSLLDLAGMQRYLTEELGVAIDLTTRSSLHPKLRDQIESEAVRVF